MDLLALVRTMEADGVLAAIAANPLAQFGVPQFPLLGATILPERLVPQNLFRESGIRYRTVIANDGSRYSPVQLKSGGVIIGDMLVELGNQTIGDQVSPEDYDALLDLLDRNADLTAVEQLINWTDTVINQPLLTLTEKQRWEALVSAQVTRVGDDGFREVVTYPNPAGQRVAAGGTWSNDAYDPFTDILAIKEYAAGKGYRIDRAFASSKVVGILTRNERVKLRAGAFRVTNATDNFLMSLSQQALGDVFGREVLPPIETYDEVYRTQTGATAPYLPDTVMVFTARTDQTIRVGLTDATARVLPSVAGYTAIGRAAGQSAPGRVIQVTPVNIFPPHIEGRGAQTSLPVITDPEAVFVINAIS